jgi:formiminoglutamate deiminase
VTASVTTELSNPPSRLHFSQALLPEGWAVDVLVTIGPDGRIASVTSGMPGDGADVRRGIALPGMPNLHSHAFQRAMAGLAERAGEGNNSFWTWRETMYQFVKRLTPEQLGAVAAQAYIEMLEAGFTSVAEFHYLHHAPDGAPYADLAEMSARIMVAAQDTGIGLTLLPVLYMASDFGGVPPAAGQRRFVNTTERFLVLVERCRGIASAFGGVTVGAAPHSLRAVTVDGLASVLPAVSNGPIHIHVAEQTKEVEDCLAWSGQRPVQWLLEHQPIGPRWCLVHATHMTSTEIRALAASGAVVGLCPITEANLGDGIFAARAFREAGGQFGIGSDSNVFISVAEELRLLEYGQRLEEGTRAALATPNGSTGRALYDAALGGAQALGQARGGIAVGARADIVALDETAPALIGRAGDYLLDAWIFAGDSRLVSDVWASGRHLVKDGPHVSRERVRTRFGRVMVDLLRA